MIKIVPNIIHYLVSLPVVEAEAAAETNQPSDMEIQDSNAGMETG